MKTLRVSLKSTTFKNDENRLLCTVDGFVLGDWIVPDGWKVTRDKPYDLMKLGYSIVTPFEVGFKEVASGER